MRALVVGLCMFMTSCLFQLDDAPKPEGVFQDRFRFDEILEISTSTSAEFSFESYRQLFFDTLPFFVDYSGEVFDRDRFIARLNQLDAEEVLVASWGPEGVNDGPLLETAPPVELTLREFVLVAGSGGVTETFGGNVRIWVRYSGVRWQIVQWREGDGKKSIFHPEYNN